ncbi:RHS repeat-associated core domain-containing protein [Actinomadura yumaensis]
MTDPLGNTFGYAYDEHGNLLAVTRPDGRTTTARYNEMNLPVEIVQPDGTAWLQEYDDRGNVVRLTDPAGATTEYAYDHRGGLAAVTDAAGNVTRLENDADGNPLSVTDPLGGTTRCAYDPMGRPLSVTDPVGGVISFGWTAEGRPAWRSLPDGSGERWTYDPEGNVVEHVDALGRSERTEYGAFDVPLAHVRPDGTRLTFTHDTELRLVAVTNAQGLSWRYEYDARGELTAETDFNGRTLRYAYDRAGRLVSRTNGAGQAVTFTRDPLGNLVEKRSGDQVTTFTHDPLGRLLRAVGPHSDLRFERDRAGRVTAEIHNGETVSVARDALGRRTGRRTPSGVESRWSYDALGLPRRMDLGGHSLTFARDRAGREVERRIGTGAILAQQWDAGHRLTAQTLWGVPATPQGQARLLQHRTYSYRADGHVLAIGDRLAGDRSLSLDSVGRVTAVDARDWTERYAYDATGNLTGAEWPAGHAPPWGDDALGDREYSGTLVRRAGRVRFEHDGQGRVVLRQHTTLSGKRIAWRYRWDADDLLVGVETPNGQRWRYRYDPLGRRVSKEHLTADGQGVHEHFSFAWDGAVLVEQNHVFWSTQRRAFASRATVWEYEPDGFRPVAQSERTRPPGTRPVWADERFYSIVTDLVGTPTELVGVGGDVVWHRRATVWDVGSPSLCPLRFPGQYFDGETGLSYNYQRYYDPTTAGYESADPLGLAPQPNPHAYVSNPLRWADPLGLAPYDFQNSHAAFKHYSKHSKGVIIGNNGNVRAKPGGPDMPEYTNFRDYRNAAGQFMGRDNPQGAIEMIRPRDGAVVRFHPGSGNFGIRTPDGVIRTFFRPDGSTTQQYQYFRDQIA